MTTSHCRLRGFKQILLFLFTCTLSIQASAQSYSGSDSSEMEPSLQDTSADLIAFLMNGGTSPTPTHLQHTITKTIALKEQLATNSSKNPASIPEEEMAALASSISSLQQYNTSLINLKSQNTDLSTEVDDLLAKITSWFEKTSQSSTLTKTQESSLLAQVKLILGLSDNLFNGTRDTKKNIQSLSSAFTALLNLKIKQGNTGTDLTSSDLSSLRTSLSNFDQLTCKSAQAQSGLNLLAAASDYHIPYELFFNQYSDHLSRDTSVMKFFFPVEEDLTSLLNNHLRFLPHSRFNEVLLQDSNHLDNRLSIQFGPCGSLVITKNTSAIKSAFSSPDLMAETASLVLEKDLNTNTIRIHKENETFIGGVFNIVLLPSYIPNGIITKLDGTTLWVDEGIAYLIASYAADWTALASSIKAAGFEPGLRGDGSVTFQIAEGEFFSGVFANDNPGRHDGACGTVTITPPTQSITAAEYAFTVSCSGSAQTQRIQPYLYQTDFYTFADASGLTLRTDRNTGIIDVENLGRFKPSFFSHAFTTDDQAYFDANANVGFAFRSSDINGDGKLDVEVLHNTSVQVLYGL